MPEDANAGIRRPLQRARQLVRQILRPPMRYLMKIYVHHDLAILSAPVRPIQHRKHRLVERIDDLDNVVGAYASQSRTITKQRVLQRFAQGLRYFELYVDDRLAATTWIIWRGTRFVDEVGYHLAVPERSFWIRDIFVSPEFRGRHLFAAFLDALIAEKFPDCNAVWSDVETENRASIRAHSQYGFRTAWQISGRHFAGLMLLRSPSASGTMVVGGFKPGRSVVLTGRAFARYCRDHLA